MIDSKLLDEAIKRIAAESVAAVRGTVSVSDGEKALRGAIAQGILFYILNADKVEQPSTLKRSPE